MTLAIALVLAGSVAHAAWNLLAVAGKDDPRAFALAYTLVVAGVSVPLAAVAAVVGGGSWDGLGTALALGVVSGLLHTAYAVALQVAYTKAPVGVVYPVARAVGPLLATLGGWIALSESASAPRVLGVALVLGGVALSLRSETGPRREGDPPPQTLGQRVAGVLGGILVGCTIAAYTVWDDFSVDARGADPLQYYGVTVLVQLVVLVLAAGRGRTRRVREAFDSARGAVFGVGLLVPTSYVLTLFAMTMAPLSVVAPLRASSIVIGAVAAAVLLREGSLRARLTAAAVLAGGVALIALPA